MTEKLLKRLDTILFEASKIPKALKSWIADYIIALDNGKDREAKQMRKDIEKEAKQSGFDSNEIFSVFGDLEREFDKTVEKARKFQSVKHL